MTKETPHRMNPPHASHRSATSFCRPAFFRLLRLLCLTVLTSVGFFSVNAATLPSVSPENAGIRPQCFLRIDSVINASIRQGITPGAVIAVLSKGQMLYEKAYGQKAVFPHREPMELKTIFDLASCTKPLATATSIFVLQERGLLHLNDPVKKFIPEFISQGKDITIMHLLTHTSGLPVYVSETILQKKYGAPNPVGMMHYIDSCRRDCEAGTRMQYSCLNYIALQHIVEKCSGMSLRDFSKQMIFDPLGMTATDFCPNAEMKLHCAPTSRLRGDSVLCGIVHDPLARIMNAGMSGNAGLFADVDDVALLIAALQRGGELNGTRILSPESVQTFVSIPDSLRSFGRTPGWDVASKYAGCKGHFMSETTYCHTGYTGTSIVVDPVSGIAIILLTNRVHPREKSSVVKLRAQIADIIGQAVPLK